MMIWNQAAIEESIGEGIERGSQEPASEGSGTNTGITPFVPLQTTPFMHSSNGQPLFEPAP